MSLANRTSVSCVDFVFLWLSTQGLVGYFTGTKLTSQNKNARTLVTSPITQHGKRPGSQPHIPHHRSAKRNLLYQKCDLYVAALYLLKQSFQSVRAHATYSSTSKSSVFVDLDRLLFKNFCGICETNTTGTSISLCIAPAETPGVFFTDCMAIILLQVVWMSRISEDVSPKVRGISIVFFSTGTCGTCKNWKTGAPTTLTIHCAACVLASADHTCSSMEASVEYASEIAAATCSTKGEGVTSPVGHASTHSTVSDGSCTTGFVKPGENANSSGRAAPLSVAYDSNCGTCNTDISHISFWLSRFFAFCTCSLAQYACKISTVPVWFRT